VLISTDPHRALTPRESASLDRLVRQSRKQQASELTRTQEEGMAKRKKQQALPGMERKRIEELDSAAETYVEARDERMKLTEREVEARQALVTAMQRHNLTVYKDESATPALIVTLAEGDPKVKVTTDASQEESEEAA
jgi:hypothetical protein